MKTRGNGMKYEIYFKCREKETEEKEQKYRLKGTE